MKNKMFCWKICEPMACRITGVTGLYFLFSAIVLSALAACGGGGGSRSASIDSSGEVVVPNVVGLTQAAATVTITGAGLTVGTVTRQPSAMIASGLVISESPSAGSTETSGSAVNLAVSTGAATAALTFVDPNPGESTIAVVNVSGQHFVTYTGAKTSSGLAQSVTAVVVDSTNQAATNRVAITVDSQGRPLTAILADGSTVGFGYVSASQINLTVTDNEGEQGSLSFNPMTGVITSVTATARNSHIKKLESSSQGRTSPSYRTAVSSGNGATGNVSVSCRDHTPISNAIVTGSFVPKNIPLSLGLPETFSLPIWPTPIGAGSFTYPAPTLPFQSDPTLAQQTLDSIPPLVSNFCAAKEDFENLSYTTVAEAIKNTPLTVYLAIELPTAIAAAVGAITVVCGANGILENTAAVANGAAVIFDFLSAGGEIQFQASRSSEQNVTTPSQNYGWLSSSPPDFAITFPCITLQVAPTNPVVLIGGTLQLSATGTDDSGTAVTISPIWDSPNADDQVATVNSAGLVAGYGAGAVTARVTDLLSGSSAVANVSASTIALQIAPTSPAVVVGGTTTLTVAASAASGAIATPPNLEWTPSDPSIATVTGAIVNGVSSATVTGVSFGTATITVKDPVSLASTSTPVTIGLPLPDATWPNPPQPLLHVPFPNGAIYTGTISGCNDSSLDSSTTQSENINVINSPPPFFGVSGFQFEGPYWPGVAITSNPFSTTFVTGTFPAVIGAESDGYQYTYSFSEVGPVFTEQLMAHEETSGPVESVFPHAITDIVLIFTSTFNLSTGIQQVTLNIKTTQNATPGISNYAGCTLQSTTSTGTGSASFTYP